MILTDLHGFMSKETGSHINISVATPKFRVKSVFEDGSYIVCLKLSKVYDEPGSVYFGNRRPLSSLLGLIFRHRASCILGQAIHYSPENAFYIRVFNQQIYFII